MSRITLNSNIQSLQANRRLGESTRSLAQSFERLSSGLRINRASDDAAGLAIADSLNTDTRVYTQGIRNANDGISLLAVAEGAVENLSNILIRMRELAEQSANGTLSFVQRGALHEEAAALRNEYNRIVGSTKFNGLNLTDASLSNVSLQVGYGVNGSIAFSAGQELAATVGTGSFDAYKGAPSEGGAGVAIGDFNNDGHQDYLSSDSSGQKVYVELNDGAGGFTQSVFASAFIGNNASLAVADLNNDGNLDVISGETGQFNIFLGDGEGAFSFHESVAVLGSAIELQVGDFNNDGNADVVVNGSGGQVSLFSGDGTGSLSLENGGFISGGQIDIGDFNGDGNLDVVSTQSPSNNMQIALGNGDGTFSVGNHTAVNKGAEVQVADFNGDGLDDFVTLKSGQARVAFSQGDGTFSDGALFSFSTGYSKLLATDINGDGYEDLIAAGNLTDFYDIMLNDGTGAFSLAATGASGPSPTTIAAGDLDGDGAIDFILGESNSSGDQVYYANGEENSELAFFSLHTQENALAAMSVIDAAMVRVSAELGELGSVASRLSSTVRNLSQATENYRSAESRIRDVDVADETANLVRAQILQEAGAAILGQANLLPQLALTLIGEG